MYSCVLSLTSALDGRWVVKVTPWSLYSQVVPGIQLYRRLGGHQGRSGRVSKISPPPGFYHRAVQPVASRYTADWAIPAHRLTQELIVWIRNQLDVTNVLSFISLLIVAQHVSGNHVPIFRSWRLPSVIVTCWYVPWLQEGCQNRLEGSVSIEAPLR